MTSETQIRYGSRVPRQGSCALLAAKPGRGATRRIGARALRRLQEVVTSVRGAIQFGSRMRFLMNVFSSSFGRTSARCFSYASGESFSPVTEYGLPGELADRAVELHVGSGQRRGPGRQRAADRLEQLVDFLPCRGRARARSGARGRGPPAASPRRSGPSGPTRRTTRPRTKSPCRRGRTRWRATC